MRRAAVVEAYPLAWKLKHAAGVSELRGIRGIECEAVGGGCTLAARARMGPWIRAASRWWSSAPPRTSAVCEGTEGRAFTYQLCVHTTVIHTMSKDVETP